MVNRILVPVDRSIYTSKAIDFAARAAINEEVVEVHLLVSRRPGTAVALLPKRSAHRARMISASASGPWSSEFSTRS